MAHSLKQGRCKGGGVQLGNLQNGDTSITDYFNKVKTLLATMVAIGEPLKDLEVVAYLLPVLTLIMSLVTTMTTISDLVGLNELYGYLLSHEVHNEKKNKTTQFSSSTNQALCSGSCSGTPRGGGNFGQGRSRGIGRNNNMPHYQICKRPNHDAS
jgi:hypothetical protein